MMRRHLYLFIYLLWWASVTASLTAQTKELYIYHTNDTHSCIEPFAVNAPDTALADKGGVARRAAFLRDERASHPGAVLLFDSGDFSQGSPYYTIYQGRVEVELMNALRYDAVALGNHEFDFGLENLARLLHQARFPVVCANYRFKGTPLEGLVHPYVILHRNGLKVGVFGLGPRLEGLVQKKCYEGVIYEDPVTAARRVTVQLQEEGCDLVVCLSHLGWQGVVSDETLIQATRGIDVVLGGHSHSYFEKPLFYRNLDGREIPVQQMGKHGRFVGVMHLLMEKK